MALMWHRYKMTPKSFKGHFKVKVNKIIILECLPRISIVTNLGKIMDKKKIDFFSKSKGFLLLKTILRYGLLSILIILNGFWAQ